MSALDKVNDVAREYERQRQSLLEAIKTDRIKRAALGLPQVDRLVTDKLTTDFPSVWHERP